MSDFSQYRIRVSHEDLEEIIREDLKEAIRDHKSHMLSYEKISPKDYEREVDYIRAKKFINAAAIVLHYYSLPEDWEELEKIEKEHEV